MTCHDAREQFSALLDDALGVEARAALDAHLAGCAECRRELDAFRRTVSLVRAIEPVPAPAGFVERVLAAARPEPWPRRLARRLFQPWPVKLPLEAAAVLIVGVLAVWLFQRMPEQQQFARDSAAPATTYRQDSPAPAMPAPRVESPTTPARPADKSAPPADKAAPPPPEPAQRADVRAQGVQAPRVLSAPAPASPSASASAPAAKPEGRESFGEGTRLLESKARKEAQAPAAAAVDPKRAQIQQAAPTERERDLGKIQGFAPPAPTSEIAGRLATPDRERAERDLLALVTKHGGAVVWRRGDSQVTLVDVDIPRDAYSRFAADVARLGRWTVEREARDLPETVRVQVQLE